MVSATAAVTDSNVAAANRTAAFRSRALFMTFPPGEAVCAATRAKHRPVTQIPQTRSAKGSLKFITAFFAAPSSKRLIEQVTLPGGIDQRAVGSQLRRLGHHGGFDLPGAEQMKDGLARRQQIVCDDPAMTAPPHGFSAHDGAGLGASALAQTRQCFAENRAHGVV